MTDQATGDSLEWLYVADVFKTALDPLRERVSRLTNLRHIRFVRLRGLEREREDAKRLYVVSDAVSGLRLSRVLELASSLSITVDVDTVLHVMRELLPAAALLHDSRSVTHGAIGPERIIVSDKGRLILADHVFGAALDKLRLSRARLWQELRVPMPPAAGVPRFDKRSDVGQVGMVALALLLGRRLTEEEFPTKLPSLLDSLTETKKGGRTARLSKPLRQWLERALPIDSRKPFLTTKDAQSALEEVVAGGSGYSPSAVGLRELYTAVAAEWARTMPPAAVEAAEPPAEVPTVVVTDVPAAVDVASSSVIDAVAAEPVVALAPREVETEPVPALPLTAAAPTTDVTGSSDPPVAADAGPPVVAPQEAPEIEVAPAAAEPPTRTVPTGRKSRASSAAKSRSRKAPQQWHPSIDQDEAEEIRRLEAELAKLAALEASTSNVVAMDPPTTPTAPQSNAPVAEVNASESFEVIDLDSALDLLADASPESPDDAWVLDPSAEVAAIARPVAIDVPSEFVVEQFGVPAIEVIPSIAAAAPAQRVLVDAVEASEPEVFSSTVAPAPEIADPVLEAFAPALEPVAPSPETAAPALETAAFALDAVAPVLETVAIAPEIVEPPPDIVSLAAEVPAPAPEAVPPTLETASPDRAEYEPGVTDSSCDVAALVSGQTVEPSPDVAEPISEVAVLAHDAAGIADEVVEPAREEAALSVEEALALVPAEVVGDDSPAFYLTAPEVLDEAPCDPTDEPTLLVRDPDHPVFDFDTIPAEEVFVETVEEPEPPDAFRLLPWEPPSDTAELVVAEELLPIPAVDDVPFLPFDTADDSAAEVVEAEPELVELAQEVIAPAWLATGTTSVLAYTFEAPLALEQSHRLQLVQLERELGGPPQPQIWDVPRRWRADGPAVAFNAPARFGDPSSGDPGAPIADDQAPAPASESAATVEAEQDAPNAAARVDASLDEADPAASVDTVVTTLERVAALVESLPSEGALLVVADEVAPQVPCLPEPEPAEPSAEPFAVVDSDASFEPLASVEPLAEAEPPVSLEPIAAVEPLAGVEPAHEVYVEALTEVHAEPCIEVHAEPSTAVHAKLSAESIDGFGPLVEPAALTQAAEPETHAQSELPEPSLAPELRDDEPSSVCATTLADELPAAAPVAAAPVAEHVTSPASELVPDPAGAESTASPVASPAPVVLFQAPERLAPPPVEEVAALQPVGSFVDASPMVDQRPVAQAVEAPPSAAAHAEAEPECTPEVDDAPPDDEGHDAFAPATSEQDGVSHEGPTAEAAAPAKGGKRGRRRKKKQPANTLVRHSSFAPGRIERPPMPAPPWLRGKQAELSEVTEARPQEPTPAPSAPISVPVAPPPAATTPTVVREEVHEAPMAAQTVSQAETMTTSAKPDVEVRAPEAAQPARSLPPVNVARLVSALVVGVVIEVVMLAGAAWWLRPSSDGRLLVLTRPDGIQVMVDGKVVGETPYAGSVAPGKHTVQLTGRRATRKLDVDVPASAQGAAFVRWPTEIASGGVTITSVPEGAQVFVDGEDKGTAPVTVLDLTVGTHAVKVTGRRGSVETSVDIKADKTVELEVPIYSGWVSVFAPVPLDIAEGGRLLGSTETDRLMLGAGTHVLELSNVQLGYQETRTVQVVPGKVVPVSIELPSAPLFVDVEPGAEIWIDGERVGYTPAMDLRAVIGTRVVVLKREGQPDERHVVSVKLSGPNRIGPPQP